MPDGGRVGFYSDWLNGPGWERFHTEELPQLLASRYRASDRRAVAGNSMHAIWGAPTVDHQIWTAHNPYDLAQDLLTTPLFISVGNGQPGPLNRGGALDRVEEALHAENIAFRARLTQLGAPATFDFYGHGSHDWPYWRRELHRAWPLLTSALA